MKPQASTLHLNPISQHAVVPRSKIANRFEHRTTFQHGKLVPIYCSQALPGANYKINLKSFIRMATPKTATMDNIVADTYFFFVPNRIIWDEFPKFMGITDDGSWDTPSAVNSPGIVALSSAYTPKYMQDDLGSYLGIYPQNTVIPYIPVNGASYSKSSVLPIRAYCAIWNSHFRDPNFERVIPFQKTSLDTTLVNHPTTITESDWMNYIWQGYGLAPVCKNRDLFTSAYTKPQKGESPIIPMNNAYLISLSSPVDLKYIGTTMSPYNGAFGSSATSASVSYQTTNMGINGSDIAGTINQLREAFAVQAYLDNDMLNTYKDSLLSHFGVTNNDDVMQEPQFLGGNRFFIDMNTIVQTAPASVTSGSSSVTTPIGYIGGQSATYDDNTYIDFTANEHGWLIGLVTTRINKHSYSQGLNPMFNFRNRFDLYSPEFANLPYQPIYKSAIYCTPTDSYNNQVFGYAPAWWQYRMKFDYNSGYFATQATNSLSFWHYGDYYESSPTLSNSFLHEDVSSINRTLAISSDFVAPYMADFVFDEVDILPMPSYSRPGLPIRA